MVVMIMRKCVTSERTPKPLQIISAFERDSLPGMIYVEARFPEQIRQACKGLIGVYLTRGIHLVPINKMSSLLMVKKPDFPVTPGSWVRILRGNYRQDLAQVVSTTENSDTLTVSVWHGSGRVSKSSTQPGPGHRPGPRPLGTGYSH